MTAPPTPTPEERLAALEAWFRDANIEYDREAVALHSTAAGAYSVRALVSLNEDQALARIPKDSVLSTKNCGIADLLETAGFDGVTGLAVAVMYERSLGPQSPWAGYLQAIPEYESIPILWSDDDVALLAGTDVEEQTARHRKSLSEEYDARVVPALTAEGLLGNAAAGAERFFSKTAFLHAASLASSRAFGVDAYHGDAMVPFADLFNHQTPSRTGEGGEHVHMVTDPEVCPHCGANGPCGCDDETDSEDHIEEVDEFHEDAEEVEEEEELVDAQSDGSGDEVEPPELYDPADWTIDDPDFDPHDPENFPETDVQDFLEMIVVRDCPEGAEVFNTYGAHGNDYLLTQYGFCEPRNLFDTLGVDADAVIAAASARVGAEKVQERVDFWKAIGREIVESVLEPEDEDGEDSEDERNAPRTTSEEMDHDGKEADGKDSSSPNHRDNFCFASTGQVSEGLLAFLHLLFSDVSRFAAFADNPESFLRHISTLRSRNWTAATPPMSKAARSAKRMGGKAAAGLPLPQSPTDRAISATLLAVATARGDAYPTTLEEDRARLKKRDALVDGPRRFALLLRIGEKEIVARAKKNYASVGAGVAARR
ncbi:hypothetical protein HDU87_002415 [Geranomyces variabilis]|uniref:Rubisco LSMT substrate-binding domain-containing protein n=1 Tax=Geranomyces variabilis TaxID=109894 RepID=A0AAD5XT92_9FUNG|nr:hypothetical protein HDU87_002415 [Geranomyces variabilis]